MGRDGEGEYKDWMGYRIIGLEYEAIENRDFM